MVLNSKNFMNKELYCFLRDKGFSEDEIIKVISSNSFFQYDFSKIDIMVKNSYDYFLDRGYSGEVIKKMAIRDPGVLGTSNRKKEKIEDCFFKLGINKNEIKKMIVDCPTLYSYSEKRIFDMVNWLINIGYTKEISVLIIKKNPNMYSISLSALDRFVNDLKGLGFNSKDILRIGKNYPAFWSKSINKVNEVINVLINLGFSMEEALKVIIGASSILGYEIDTIIKRFNDLVSLDFSCEEVKKMIIDLPTLIVSDIERTRMIVEFFTSINLRDKIKTLPKSFFMQGVETSYARYCFYIDMGIVIDENNFRKLFYGWSFYKRNYGVTKESLLSEYDYNRDINGIRKKS